VNQLPRLAAPRLATRRLVLRQVEVADATRVRVLAGDPDVALMTSNIPYPYEVGMATSWIATSADLMARGLRYAFALELPGDGLVGVCSLQIEPAEGRAELGYWVGKRWWGQGYATEGARAVVAFGFERLGLRRIFAHHMAENPASGRVMAKIGMTREGVLRQHVLHRGRQPVDMVVWGMLAEELGGPGPGSGPGMGEAGTG
jgi:ribosomal-protein-alanine N-acetyltransferase